LGTSSAHGTGIQRFCCYLLQINEGTRQRQILLDAGSSRVVDPNWVDLDRVDAIFITHLHGDHTFFLGELIKRMQMRNRTKIFTIVAHRFAIPWLRIGIRVWNQMQIPGFIRFYPVFPEGDESFPNHSIPFRSHCHIEKSSRSKRLGLSALLERCGRWWVSDPKYYSNPIRLKFKSQPIIHPNKKNSTNLLCGEGIRRAESFKIHDYFHFLHPTPFPEIYSTRLQQKYKNVYVSGEHDENIGISFQAANTTHPMWTVTYRFQFTENIRKFSLVFTPDHCCNDPTPAKRFAKDADYWLLDSTYIKSNPNPGTFYPGLHSSLEYSEVLCKWAGVKTYLIGHYCWDRQAPTYVEAIKELRRYSGKIFSGNILLTEECKPFKL